MTSRWKMVLVAAALVAFAAAPASAQTFRLTATLTGANEPVILTGQTVPGINTGAFGDATVIVDMGARTVTYTVNVFNLPSGVTASHIHAGAAGTAGRSSSTSRRRCRRRTTSGSPATIKDTEFILRPDQGIRSADDMFQAILGGNSYVNVHSTVNPGGEIRGQLILSR